VCVVHESSELMLPVLCKVEQRLWETQLEEVAEDLSKHAEHRLDEVIRDS
jgi:hypothetical protein